MAQSKQFGRRGINPQGNTSGFRQMSPAIGAGTATLNTSYVGHANGSINNGGDDEFSVGVMFQTVLSLLFGFKGRLSRAG